MVCNRENDVLRHHVRFRNLPVRAMVRMGQ